MWIEAILSKEDLEALVRQFTPLTIHVGDGDGTLVVSDPERVRLVADEGLRVVCKAKLTWPVLGIKVPISLHSLVVMLRPIVEKRSSGEALVFKVEIEHADLANVPSMIDDRITELINQDLSDKHVELAWSFSKALTHAFKLPRELEPLEAFELIVFWGKTKITDDAVVLAVSFHSAVTRHQEAARVGDQPRA